MATSKSVGKVAMEVFGAWYGEHVRLAYWTAHRTVRRQCARLGVTLAASAIEEHVQDGVCRGLEWFCRKADEGRVSKADRPNWVYRAVVAGTRKSLRAKSSFGSLADPAAVRDDAMRRYRRVRPEGIHGTAQERELLDPEYKPMRGEATPPEVLAVIEREVPEILRGTARCAAFGISQQDTATMLGISVRQVQRNMYELRKFLGGANPNPYSVIVSACKAVLSPAE